MASPIIKSLKTCSHRAYECERVKKKVISSGFTSYYVTLCNTIFKKTTPSILNYKSFQESYKVKAFSSLTKNIETNIKIYVIK